MSAQAGEALLHQRGASPMGPPHQPVLFLAAAVEKGSLWGGRMVGWGVFLELCTRGGSHLKRRREADGRKKLEGVRKEGCGRKKTGGWCLLLCSCGMKMTPSSRRKLSVCRWLILLVGLRRAGGICEKYGSVSVSAGPSDTSRRSAGVTAGLPA